MKPILFNTEMVLANLDDSRGAQLELKWCDYIGKTTMFLPKEFERCEKPEEV